MSVLLAVMDPPHSTTVLASLGSGVLLGRLFGPSFVVATAKAMNDEHS